MTDEIYDEAPPAFPSDEDASDGSSWGKTQVLDDGTLLTNDGGGSSVYYMPDGSVVTTTPDEATVTGPDMSTNTPIPYDDEPPPSAADLGGEDMQWNVMAPLRNGAAIVTNDRGDRILFGDGNVQTILDGNQVMPQMGDGTPTMPAEDDIYEDQ
jgi:hypothetical protein